METVIMNGIEMVVSRVGDLVISRNWAYSPDSWDALHKPC